MRYLNGCIEVETNHIPGYVNVLKANELFTRHPVKRDVWYFFKNHIGVELFKDHYDFFMKYWDVSDEVIEELFEWSDYTDGHPKIPQHNLDSVVLKYYQQIAVDKMLSNDKYCIFLGQGTGKTIITLTYIKSIFEEEGPQKVLVVTPKKVIGQYSKEAKKYLKQEWIPYIEFINYESLSKAKGPYEIICYDESHKLKNCSAQVNKKATALRAKRIYLFTGSPQDKYKHEILAQLKVLQPYLFPAKFKVYERYFFLDDYGNPIKDKKGTELDDIIVAMSYGDQTENLLELPKANHLVHKCKFKDKTIYDTLKKKQVVDIEGNVIMADNPAVLRIKLKEMCNGFLFFDYFDEVTCKQSRKMLELENPKLDTLRELVTSMDTGIIYTQFDYDIVTVSKLLNDLNISHVCVNGKTTDSDPLIESFKEGKVRFLVIQAISGNAGLDLQNTNNMIFYSLPDSYIIFEQCTYRIRRIGQTKECNYYYLITEGTVELAIHRALKNKKSFNNNMFELYRKED